MNDVKVPEENLLGKEGGGFKIAMSALDNGRFTVASGSVGVIQAEYALGYRKDKDLRCTLPQWPFELDK